MKDTISATEQEQAVRQLMTELEKGRKSGETGYNSYLRKYAFCL